VRNRRDPTRSGFVGPAFGRGVLLQVIQLSRRDGPAIKTTSLLRYLAQPLPSSLAPTGTAGSTTKAPLCISAGAARRVERYTP